MEVKSETVNASLFVLYNRSTQLKSDVKIKKRVKKDWTIKKLRFN